MKNEFVSKTLVLYAKYEELFGKSVQIFKKILNVLKVSEICEIYYSYAIANFNDEIFLN